QDAMSCHGRPTRRAVAGTTHRRSRVSSEATRGGAPQPSILTQARLLRERDQLILLHEALADVERARSLEERMRILVDAIRRVGYGRVDTVATYTMPDDASVVAWISHSVFLNSNELVVPVRTVGGTL